MPTHDLTTPEGRLANMLAFHDKNRAHAAAAGYWYDVRVWHVLPDGYTGTPSHWESITFTRDRSSAGMIAQALHRAYGWACEVWSCSPVVDPDIPPNSTEPVAWHLTDRYGSPSA